MAVVGKGMRTYVEVLLRVAPDGTETPEVVMLPDGRLFRIGRVEARRRVGDGYAFTVSIGNHVTTLWKEASGWSGPRWFVVLRRERRVPRADAAAGADAGVDAAAPVAAAPAVATATAPHGMAAAAPTAASLGTAAAAPTAASFSLVSAGGSGMSSAAPTAA